MDTTGVYKVGILARHKKYRPDQSSKKVFLSIHTVYLAEESSNISPPINGIPGTTSVSYCTTESLGETLLVHKMPNPLRDRAD